MELTNSEFLYYVANKLKLPPGRRSEYIEQVDRLIANFAKAAAEDSGLAILKFLKTGSLWKGTVLKPYAGEGVDADIAVFIDEEATAADILDRLHQHILDLLIPLYPNKNQSDFTVQPRTLGIHFIDSGLDVDLVPIIPLANDPEYGYQPSSVDQPLVITSVSGQLSFIRKFKDDYYNWTALVRLLKRWRNFQELPQLRSFAIELIVCFLQMRDGIPESIGDGLSRFWLFLAQELSDTIVYFDSDRGGLGLGAIEVTPVRIIDPVNNNNNVTIRISGDECDEIQVAAEKSWELYWSSRDVATKSETLEDLKSIFGRNFVTED